MLQRSHHRTDVSLLCFPLQRLHGAVYALVRLYIKTLWFKNFHNCVECAFFKHDSPEHCLFKIFGLGWNFAVNHCAEIEGGFSSGFSILIYIGQIH